MSLEEKISDLNGLLRTKGWQIEQVARWEAGLVPKQLVEGIYTIIPNVPILQYKQSDFIGRPPIIHVEGFEGEVGIKHVGLTDSGVHVMLGRYSVGHGRDLTYDAFKEAVTRTINPPPGPIPFGKQMN